MSITLRPYLTTKRLDHVHSSPLRTPVQHTTTITHCGRGRCSPCPACVLLCPPRVCGAHYRHQTLRQRAMQPMSCMCSSLPSARLWRTLPPSDAAAEGDAAHVLHVFFSALRASVAHTTAIRRCGRGQCSPCPACVLLCPPRVCGAHYRHQTLRQRAMQPMSCMCSSLPSARLWRTLPPSDAAAEGNAAHVLHVFSSPLRAPVGHHVFGSRTTIANYVFVDGRQRRWFVQSVSGVCSLLMGATDRQRFLPILF